MLPEHEMFDKFGGGETSKQGQAVETISCQANNVGQFLQALSSVFNEYVACVIDWANVLTTLPDLSLYFASTELRLSFIFVLLPLFVCLLIAANFYCFHTSILKNEHIFASPFHAVLILILKLSQATL